MIKTLRQAQVQLQVLQKLQNQQKKKQAAI
jgi:hypothetical protein